MGSSVSVGCGLIKFIAEGLSSALSGILSPHRTSLDILHTVATDVCGRWQIGFFNSDINIVMNVQYVKEASFNLDAWIVNIKVFFNLFGGSHLLTTSFKDLC